MVSIRGSPGRPKPLQHPYIRFDVVGTAAERCDELRRMTDDSIAVCSSKKLKLSGNVALQQSADVPDPHLFSDKAIAAWWKARYSKSAIRLLEYDLMSNLTFVLGMPFIVPMESSGIFMIYIAAPSETFR